MAIVANVNKYEFIRAFEQFKRVENFSRDGLCAIFDYLEQMSEDLGSDIGMDVVGICCEFSEYDSSLEAAIEYGFKVDSVHDEETDEEQLEIDALEWLQDRTTVITVDQSNKVIIQEF